MAQFKGLFVVKSITIFCAALLLGACSSVSDSIPTVKIEKRKTRAAVQTVDYNPTLTATTTQATLVCDNAKMRARALDSDPTNDSARIVVVEDGQRDGEPLAEAEVNCRDYFARLGAQQLGAGQRISAAAPRLITASTPTPHIKPEAPRPAAAVGYIYKVRKGDTVWDIARENCTDVKTIARLNGLSSARTIDIGQVLELPAERCNRR